MTGCGTSCQPSTPLALAADPWLSRPEYYSTLQTGDVDGDGRDDVIARGPFGIRTWFYNRRDTGGGSGISPMGTQRSRLPVNRRLHGADRSGGDQQRDSRRRDVGARRLDESVSARPGYLTTLQSGLASIANCTGQAPGNPPSYQACTPPAGSSGFTAADWTAVVNQMLSESYAAGQVVALFAQLQRMRESLFIADRGDLPDSTRISGCRGRRDRLRSSAECGYGS